MVSTMFDIKKYNHMVMIVSFGYWNEDPVWLGFIWLNSYPQVMMEDYVKS